MAEKYVGWVDAGMAVLAGGFVAIAVLLRDVSFYVPLLIGYAALTIIWAVVAEWAAIRAEAEPAVMVPRLLSNDPLPH